MPQALASIPAVLLAHPVGIAILGGTAVGASTYYLLKKLSKPKKDNDNASEATAKD